MGCSSSSMVFVGSLDKELSKSTVGFSGIPIGFAFHPFDRNLVTHYLYKKLEEWVARNSMACQDIHLRESQIQGLEWCLDDSKYILVANDIVGTPTATVVCHSRKKQLIEDSHV
ncbi:unnamed protein product [Dovyalis caffra]|uniref:NAC domain-containing protein n=1 Tax=Dovyalis caffra TaxID=77055 RepID=A0AAV1RSI2_9ROSI|nr:unnamed protein product [Dovyalis caffra]